MRKDLSALLACPLCHSALLERRSFLQCSLCARKYPFVGGVADFRVSPNSFVRFRIAYLRLREFFRTHTWKEILQFLFHSRNSPHQIAMGASFGVFLSVIPSFVLGAILALFISWRRKYHLPATYFGTLIVNPFNGPFVYFMNYKVGTFLLGEKSLDIFPITFASLSDLGIALYLGGFLVAFVSAVFVYAVVYGCVHGYRRFRKNRFLK